MLRTLKILALAMTLFGWGCADTPETSAPIVDTPQGDLGGGDVDTGRLPEEMEDGAGGVTMDPPPMPPAPPTPPTPPTPPVDGEACDLEGVAAVKIVAQVTWPATLAMEAGSGVMNIWFRANLQENADGVINASGYVCETEVPDFRTNALAGGDTHGTVIPGDAWQGAPETILPIQLSAKAPGATIAVNATPMLLGASMNDLNGPWPRSHRDLQNVDHDADGFPGVTSYAAMGPDYANPRVDILDATQRAERIFLGLRNVIGFNGTLNSCTSAAGAASLILEQRAFGCIREDGEQCTAAQTDLLDGNMPAFQVESATFELERMDGPASCADIRERM